LEFMGGSKECGKERVTRAESRRFSAGSSMSARNLRRGALATVEEEVSCEGQSRVRRWSSRCVGRRIGRQFEVGEAADAVMSAAEEPATSLRSILL
jgi:hypothetical protein